MLSSYDEAVLAQQDMRTLARWWNLINAYDWPEELENPEPRHYISGGRRGQLMRWIENSIGLRACIREHNMDMPEEIFNSFWRGHFEGVQHERARYDEWQWGKIRERHTQPTGDAEE